MQTLSELHGCKSLQANKLWLANSKCKNANGVSYCKPQLAEFKWGATKFLVSAKLEPHKKTIYFIKWLDEAHEMGCEYNETASNVHEWHVYATHVIVIVVRMVVLNRNVNKVCIPTSDYQDRPT